MKTSKYYLAILPVLHICLCLAIQLGVLRSIGSWTWFPVFFVDFPFSIVLLPLVRIFPPFPTFLVAGTLWWYLIGWLLISSFRKLTELFSNRRHGNAV